LQFGGVVNGKWKSYEIEWLRSLAVPLYLVRVSSDCSRIDLYSLWPIWIVLAQSRNPFRIICQCDEPESDPQVLRSRSAEVYEGSHGDAKEWTVPLGTPFLSFTQSDMNNPTFVAGAGALMSNWVAVDRRNVIHALLGAPYVKGIKEWATNDFARTVLPIKEFMSWSTSRQTAIELAMALEPLAVNLGVHLQLQDDRGVYSFIPLLEWLDSLKLLGGMGKGLLEGVKQTQAAGLSPKQQPSG